MKKILFTSLILFTFFSIKAQIFSSKQVTSVTNSPQVVKSADFNNDGYIDIVYSSITDHKIAINLFNSTTGAFDEEQIVTSSFYYAVSIFPADLNDDNLCDFLVVSQQNNTVAWFKNDGTGNFTLQTLINDNAINASSVIAVNIDNDGDLDVVSAAKGDNKILWYENDGSGNFSAPNEITITGGIPVVIISADINNDNYPDIIAGYALTDKIVSFTNNGDGTFGAETQITNQTDYIISLKASDFNNDGNVDIVSVSKNDNKLAWYKNLHGIGTFSEQIVISNEISLAFEVDVADFDLDNDVDIICTAQGSNKVFIFQNTDGNGNFTQYLILPDETESPKGISVNDFDNDGDIDFVAALPGGVAWFENGKATFVVHNIHQIRDVSKLAICDINNDGNNDIFYSDFRNVCWVENQNSGQSFGNEIIIYPNGANIYEIKFADIDNDGDMDLFVADALADKLMWFENTDGNGIFSSAIMIDEEGNGPVDIDFSDIDGDNDLDIVVALANEYAIAIFENTDDLGTFSKTIILENIEPHSLCFSDIDNDNDNDIIYSAYTHTGYLENDGAGNFSNTNVISADMEYSSHILPTDLNNDGYEEIISNPDLQLHWLENNQNNTFQGHTVDMWGSVYKNAVGDLDNDNDIEIVAACQAVEMVHYAENINYADTFHVALPILVEDPRVVEISDLNNDGYNDIVIGTYPAETLNWAENYQFRIINHPFDQFVCEGDKGYFSVLSTGVKTYQWQINTGSGFTDITNNAAFSGSNKAQLIINEVTSGMFGNEFRCLVYDKNNFEQITEAATLTEYVPSIVCLANQERTSANSKTYIVIGNEFDLDTVYNKCSEDILLVNSYNGESSLSGEIFNPGTHTITWEIKNASNQVIDNCIFEVEILDYVGIKENIESEISIYPNPTTGIFTIKNNSQSPTNNYQIEITDIIGKTIKQLSIVNNQSTIVNLKNQPASVYFLKIQTEKEIITKIIIKK